MRPVGPVPLELTDVYPVGCYLAPEEFDARPASASLAEAFEGLAVDLERDWLAAWTRRQVDALLAWRYGPAAAAELAHERLEGRRSPKTGQLRRIERDGGDRVPRRGRGARPPDLERGRAPPREAAVPAEPGRRRRRTPFRSSGRGRRCSPGSSGAGTAPSSRARARSSSTSPTSSSPSGGSSSPPARWGG